MGSTRAEQRYTPLLSDITPHSDLNDLARVQVDAAGYIELDALRGISVDSNRVSRGFPAKVETSQRYMDSTEQDEPAKTHKALKTLRAFFKRIHASITVRLERSGFHGWRVGVLIGCCLSTVVLCCNIALVIVGSTVNGGFQSGVARIAIGTSKKTATWSTIAHLFINMCSTLLLAASNYTMQILSAPTRDDIDRAHGQWQWYDIGLLSIRNIRNVPRRRAALWLVLALSSVPLHLFYNAAIFRVLAVNEYDLGTTVIQSQGWWARNQTYDQLSNAQWREIYDARYVTEHSDLILVIDRLAYNTSQSSTLPLSQLPFVSLENRYYRDRLPELTSESWEWLRYDRLIRFARSSQLANETVPGTNITWGSTAWPVSARVAHAFSLRTPPNSSLRLSLVYMVIVIVFNILKLSIMVWILTSQKSAYLVTVGDATASFLQRPDQVTVDLCVLGKIELLDQLGPSKYPARTEDERDSHTFHEQGMWLPRKRRYAKIVGRDRQVIYIFMLCVLVLGVILIPSIEWTGQGPLEHLQQWGSSSQVVLPIRAGSLLAALLANIPQLILSSCYVVLNSICTSFAAAREWNSMAKLRKGLRVTQPQQEQRSTYFLSLPYKWALPLMATSGLLHWLLSQSLFLFRADMYTRKGAFRLDSSRLGLGFSALSLFVFTVVALLLVLAVGYVGTRSMRETMPVAASCSLVISAACHPPSDDQDAHLKKVKWGVVGRSPGSGYTHCSITAKDTRKPIVGQVYR